MQFNIQENDVEHQGDVMAWKYFPRYWPCARTNHQGPVSILRPSYLCMAISMLKIRRPLGRLIFNMGIAIPGKTVFLIETAPCVFPTQRASNASLSRFLWCTTKHAVKQTVDLTVIWHAMKLMWCIVCKMVDILLRPQCVNLSVLTFLFLDNCRGRLFRCHVKEVVENYGSM